MSGLLGAYPANCEVSFLLGWGCCKTSSSASSFFRKTSQSCTACRLKLLRGLVGLLELVQLHQLVACSIISGGASPCFDAPCQDRLADPGHQYRQAHVGLRPGKEHFALAIAFSELQSSRQVEKKLGRTFWLGKRAIEAASTAT